MPRVLLDEDVPEPLRQSFEDGMQVETVGYRKWKGFDNGDLLEQAASEYDVLVTQDDNLSHQQDISRYDIAVIVLRGHTDQLHSLKALMAKVNKAVREIDPGEVIRIYPTGPP